MTHYNRELHYSGTRWSGFERLKVTEARTSFFEGREFRTFKELSIAASGVYTIKVVLPVDIVVIEASADIEAGQLRLTSAVGGTEGGSWSETLPIRAANSMSMPFNRRVWTPPATAYVPVVVMTAGGTITGQTELEVIRLKANANANQATSVGGGTHTERGIGAGTFYFRFQNLSAVDAITGVFRLRWEERPGQV